MTTNTTKKKYTLLFIHQNDDILLGFKKRGLGTNKWNGFGGKVEAGEEIIDAAIRELHEECSLSVLKQDVQYMGFINFIFHEPPMDFEVYVYKTTNYTGDMKESEEMRPKWFKVNEIPYDNMWPDDAVWYPYMIANKTFRATFYYQNESEMLNNYEIKSV